MGWQVAVGLLAAALTGTVALLWREMSMSVRRLEIKLDSGLDHLHHEIRGVNGERQTSLRRVHEQIEILSKALAETNVEIHTVATKYRGTEDCDRISLPHEKRITTLETILMEKRIVAPSEITQDESTLAESSRSEHPTKPDFPPQ